jgi:hypothetical protein
LKIASFVVLGALALAACTPASQYNRGVDVNFQNAGGVATQNRMLNSAIELKTEADQVAIKEAGGVLIGELTVIAERTSNLGESGGAAGLGGRISIEAGGRGATHFYLAASDVVHATEYGSRSPGISFAPNNSQQVSRTKARYNLFRVEEANWDKLPKGFKPDASSKAAGASAAPVASAAPTAPAPSVPPASAAAK